MNKAEMINQIAGDYDLSKVKAKQIVEQVFDVIGNDLKKEGRFTFPNLGTFTVTERAARKGRNPATGEPSKLKPQKLFVSKQLLL
ncbi:HU family DNA-binding protein [Undibacterium sp. SXout11W]|uniref:HU family DNA-binding protein n=1 Tax=Undibacterium sp. SXout11W TaxID=3413050 RepID=UPI003BEFEB74